MPPEFDKRTKDTLGKRAALLCSNPDCRTTTAGPKVDPSGAVNIGEAAHIFGAFAGAARYREDMTDGSRAEITNGIWLCRNCHKLVDNDPTSYTSDLLFMWKGEHERYVAHKIGSRAEIIRLEARNSALGNLLKGRPLAEEIAREKLLFWEFRLIAELLRANLRGAARTWFDLKANLLAGKRHPVPDEEVLQWFRLKLSEATDFLDPLDNLYTVELEKAWGPPGQPGDVEAIVHVCELFGRLAAGLVRWEEEVRFVWVSDVFRPLVIHLQGTVGRQLEKVLEIPAVFDDAVDKAEASPGATLVIEHILTFDLPEGWSDQISKELRKIERDAGYL